MHYVKTLERTATLHNITVNSIFINSLLLSQAIDGHVEELLQLLSPYFLAKPAHKVSASSALTSNIK